MTIKDLYKQNVDEMLKSLKNYEDIDNNETINDLYQSVIIDLKLSNEYQKLMKEYNNLFNSIEDKELKKKFSKLNELNNSMYAEYDKTLFKLGFSTGIKIIIEALNFRK